MAQRGTTKAAALAAVVGAALLTACEPAPPRTTFVVNSTIASWDVAPGDGECADLGGRCTITAALEEAAATDGGVDIVLPGGRHESMAPATGDVRITASAPQSVQLYGTLSITAGSRLTLENINAALPTPPVTGALVLEVAGEAHVSGSHLNRVVVEPGGVVVLGRSIVMHSTGEGGGAVVNRGTLVAADSTLASYPDADGLVLDNTGGHAILRSSAIATPTVTMNGGLQVNGGNGTCTGGTYEILGDVHVEVPCAGLAPEVSRGNAKFAAALTTSSPAGSLEVRISFLLPIDSPLVDAIPLDDPICTSSLPDFTGATRGVDGNGDGVGGCDIGALERPAA